MIEPINTTGLALSIAIPWLFGSFVVSLLLCTCSSRNLSIILGHGYIVGLLGTTLTIRLWDALDISLNFWGIVLLITFFSVTMWAVRSRFIEPVSPVPRQQEQRVSWSTILIGVLLLLILSRYLSLLQEMAVRPLYAWDAWMNWVPKAVIWFQNGELSSFVSPRDWLGQLESMESYTLGNWAAWRYPPMVPLIQLWSMLGAGTSDHNLIYFPWFLAPLSLGLAFYGHLKLAGFSTLASVAIVYLLLTVPYLNVHTVLVGYADIWLTLAFSLGVLAVNEAAVSKHWSYSTLAVIMAISCMQLKVPGIFLGMILIGVTLLQSSRVSKCTLLVVAGFGAMAVLYIVAVGVDITIPGLGEIVVGSEKIMLPHIGSFEITFHPVYHAFAESLLVSGSWSLLWYLLAITLVVYFVRGVVKTVHIPLLLSLSLGILFVIVVFFFSRHYLSALNMTTLNRALLYLVPAVVLFLATAWRSIAESIIPPLKDVPAGA